MKYTILAGGLPPSEKLLRQQIKESDKLIGVDGAADILTDYGITADYIIGDFDSAKKKNILIQQNAGASVIRLEKHKDVTDTEAALELAIEHGAKHVVLLGALGSRQDHAQANIALLKHAYEHDVFAKILDDNNELFVTDGSFTLHSPKGQTISILPLCRDIKVNAEVLLYPLDDLRLRFGSSRGVSNIMKHNKAVIKVEGGYALIILSNGKL